MNLKDVHQTLHSNLKNILALVFVFVIGLIFLLCVLFKPAKTVDFIPEIKALTTSVRMHFQKSIDYRGLNTTYAVEHQLAPKEMIRLAKLFSKTGSEILIGKDMAGNTVPVFEKTFTITYLNLNQKKCTALLLSEFAPELGLLSIFVSNDESYELTYGGKLSLPATKQTAQSLCKNKNSVMLIFE